MTKISKTCITHNGKRVTVNYFTGPWVGGIDPTTIKIRPKRHAFPREFRDVFTIENNSDLQTDYFESDCIRITANHPLYVAIKEAARR